MAPLGALAVRTLTDAVVAHLRAASPQLGVFDAGVDRAPSDPDGRAHPFVVVWPAPGTADQDRLTAALSGIVWRFQVTCAGGDRTRAAAAVDAARQALTGQRITIAAAHVGRAREIGDAGPLTEEREADPSRWSTALVYSLHVTRRST